MRHLLAVLAVAGLLVGLIGVPASAGADVRPLPLDTDVDYQLGGSSPPAPNVGIVVRDRTARPVSGLYNVCYVNGFQTQPNQRAFWKKRGRLLLRHQGRLVVDEAWGEWLLDIRTPTKRRALARIMKAWIRGCARKGFDAVEFDNLDSFSRSQRLIKRRHALAFARKLVRQSHRLGLATGQKNTAGLNGTKLGFDFAVAEQCAAYDECGRYVDSFGRQVLAIEYTKRHFKRACAQFGEQLAIVYRDLDLSPKGVRRWC